MADAEPEPIAEEVTVQQEEVESDTETKKTKEKKPKKKLINRDGASFGKSIADWLARNFTEDDIDG